MLKLALKHGLKLKRVNAVMAFKQRPWLAEYVELNTKKRQNSKSNIEKDFYKLMINCIFGKMIEAFRTRRNVRIFRAQGNDRYGALKHASHPWFRNFSILEKDKMILLETAYDEVMLARPIIVGQAILDISKWLMYSFHYEIMKPYWGDNIKLCYSDTDSFTYHITLRDRPWHEELYQMQRLYDCFDLSELQDPNDPMLQFVGPDGIKLNPKMNAKVPGKFKDESKGVGIHKATFLRSKMYSMVLNGNIIERHPNQYKRAKGKQKLKNEICKKKGIPRKIEMTYAMYEEVLQDPVAACRNAKISFSAIDHEKNLSLVNIVKTKKGLLFMDDKSCWITPTVVYRYGDYRLEEFKEEIRRTREFWHGLDQSVEEERKEWDTQEENIRERTAHYMEECRKDYEVQRMLESLEDGTLVSQVEAELDRDWRTLDLDDPSPPFYFNTEGL